MPTHDRPQRIPAPRKTKSFRGLPCGERRGSARGRKSPSQDDSCDCPPGRSPYPEPGSIVRYPVFVFCAVGGVSFDCMRPFCRGLERILDGPGNLVVDLRLPHVGRDDMKLAVVHPNPNFHRVELIPVARPCERGPYSTREITARFRSILPWRKRVALTSTVFGFE